MNVEQRSSISLLLGAGFSVPMGYPTGGAVNRDIMEFDKFPVSISPDGTMVSSTDGNKPDFGYTNSYMKRFALCKALIAEYAATVGRDKFDYEQFMDFLRSREIFDDKYAAIGEKFTDQYNDYKSMVGGLPDIYSQMVCHLLEDANKASWYEDSYTHIGDFSDEGLSDYNGFLHFIKAVKDDYVINLHTLNHDLFFENLTHNDAISGDFSDGFDDYHSRYYGKLRINKEGKFQEPYMCRLERYTGRYYGKAIRLYKLHGSLNYVLMHRTDKNGFVVPEAEVKIRRTMALTDLFRERTHGNGYDNDFFSYHADFLTGTTSKILQYRSRYFYKKVFKRFKANLAKAEALVIIGYGCKDEGINKMLLETFDHSKPSYIVDPFADKNSAISDLAGKLGAKVLTMGVKDIKKESFKI